VRILAKESLFKVPVLGHVLHRLGVLPVNRAPRAAWSSRRWT
jgi:1-acyl-sn-glycerol-3-phosphate acyltransferase